jgi:hypothetical protein
MNERNTVRCDVLIVTGAEEDLVNLEKTINSLKNQFLQPNGVCVMLRNYNLNMSKVAKLISSFDIWWINNDTDENDDVWSHIDYAVQSCKGNFYTVIQAGYELPTTFISDIDFALNELNERFVLLEPADETGNCLTVHTPTHNRLKGNRPGVIYEDQENNSVVYSETLVDKLKFLAEQHNQHYMIRSIREICNQV